MTELLLLVKNAYASIAIITIIYRRLKKKRKQYETQPEGIDNQ